MTSFGESQLTLVSGSMSIMEAARARAIADAAAVAEANNVPLIATAPPDTPDPGVWQDTSTSILDRPLIVNGAPVAVSMADRVRRLARPFALVVLVGAAMVALSMTDKPGRGEPFR